MPPTGAKKRNVDMESDGGRVVTMMDVLQEQEEFEEDATAVLGASDEKNCTYSKGYIKRQAVYVCFTCCPESKTDPSKRAGVCLACSLTCHENHDLAELYTKRNFCCDCGNPKFNSHPCQYTPHKFEINEDNKYNQNFSGLYCVCHRPYPDPEATVDDDMIQCIICEDWLHSEHLEATVPTNDQYSEMICKECMEKIPFLNDYTVLAVNTDDLEVTVEDSEKSTNDPIVSNCDLKNGNTADVSEEASINDTNVNTKINGDTSKECGDKNAIDNDQIDENKLLDTGDVVVTEGQSDQIEEELKEDKNSALAVESEKDEKCKQVTDVTVSNEAETNSDSKQSQEVDDMAEDIGEAEKSKVKENDVLSSTEDMDNSEALDSTEPQSDTIPTENEELKSVDNDLIPKTSNTEPDMESADTKIEDVGNNQKMDDISENKEEDQAKAENTETQSPILEENSDKQNDSDKNKSNDEEINETIDKDECLNKTDTEKVIEEEKNENKRKLSTEDVSDVVTQKKPRIYEKNYCVRPKGVKSSFKGATFWPGNFRQKLCICNECITMYKDLSVLFIIDPDDTVTAYETLGKKRNEGTKVSQYEKGLEALSSLDRVQQINALTEYNKMRDKLLDFLKSFKDRKEIVKEEDIKAFFAGMKPTREPDGVYFCR